MEKMANVLRLNSQIKKLTANKWLNDILNPNYFQDANEVLQNIETLVILETNFTRTIGEYIQLKNLKKLFIDMLDIFENQPFIFPFTGNQLESLTMLSEIPLQSPLLFNIIEQFPKTVKKLKICDLDPMDFSELSKKLPLLEEIVFSGSDLAADEILCLINDIQSLRSLVFNTQISEKIFEKDDLGNGWSVLYKRCIHSVCIDGRFYPYNEAPVKYAFSLKRQI